MTELSVSGERSPDGSIKFTPLEIPVYVERPEEIANIFRQDALVGAVAGPGPSGLVYVVAYTASLTFTNVVTVPLEIKELTATGTYLGQVDVTDNNDEKDAVKLTVVIADATEEAVKPLVTDLSVKGFRDLLTQQVAYGAIVVPLPAPGTGWTTTTIETPVGAVSGPGQMGTVRQITCSDSSATSGMTGVTPICLDIDGLNATGTYAGQADLRVLGDGADVVKLAVTVSDEIGWAILASVAGVIIASIVLWLAGSRVRYLDMSSRARDLAKQIKDLNDQREPARKDYTIASDEYFKAFWKQFHRYSARLIWDTASEDYKALVKLLDNVDADISRFQNDLVPALKSLEDKDREFNVFLRTDPLGQGVDKRPPLTNDVVRHFKGTSLPIGQLQARLDTWKALIDLMQTWMTMSTAISCYRQWIELLKSHLGPDDELLAYVNAKLTEVSDELYRISTVQDLASLSVQKEIEEVYGILAEWGGQYSVPKPEVLPVKVRRSVVSQDEWTTSATEKIAKASAIPVVETTPTEF